MVGIVYHDWMAGIWDYWRVRRPTGVLEGLFWLGTLVPSLAVGVRRLHDINRTGWWLLLVFVPGIGWIVLIVWAIKRGDKGQNKYGPDPRQAVSQQPYNPQ